MNKVLQAKAINLNLGLKDVFLLEYIKRNFIISNDFVSSEIVDENPLLTTKDIKESLEKLEDAGLIIMTKEWDRGKFSLRPNIENLISLYTIDNVEIKREKKKSDKKSKEIEMNDDELKIFEHYKTLSSLPDYKKITDKGLIAIKDALSNYNVETITDALSYANEQQWLIKKSSEHWCNFVWIISRIGDFIPGGKYRKKQEIKKENPIPLMKASVIL